jgi:hypothetical protein
LRVVAARGGGLEARAVVLGWGRGVSHSGRRAGGARLHGAHCGAVCRGRHGAADALGPAAGGDRKDGAIPGCRPQRALRELQSRDGARVHAQLAEALEGAEVPHADRRVARAGVEQLLGRAHAQHGLRVRAEGVCSRARPGRVDCHGTVIVACIHRTLVLTHAVHWRRVVVECVDLAKARCQTGV